MVTLKPYKGMFSYGHLFFCVCIIILFYIHIHVLLLTIQHKNTIERTMKVTFNEKEYEIKYSFRAYMIYENIMGKSFSPQGLTDMIIFFYANLLAAAKGDTIKYEDFLDWLDDNPDELNKFSKWLMECLGLNKFLTPEVKDTNKKANKKEDKPKN